MVSRGVRGRVGVRVRLLGIVLISSVTLLALGIGAASYLVRSGQNARQWAELASSTTTPAIAIIDTVGEERRLSMLHLAGDPSAAALLVPARERSDAALAALIAKGDAARRMNPGDSASDIAAYDQLFTQLPLMRHAVDTRQAPPDQVFGLFTKCVEVIAGASMIAARVAPDAAIAVQLGYAVEPLRASEALSKAVTLGELSIVTGTMAPEQWSQFTDYVGEFRGQMAYSRSVLQGDRAAQLDAITSSPEWAATNAMIDAIATRGPQPTDSAAEPSGDTSSDSSTSTSEPATSGATADSDGTAREQRKLPMTMQAWQDNAARVGSGLQQVWEDASRDAHAAARAQGDRTTAGSLAGGGAVLLISILAFVAALVLANRFIGRMRRLRRETLQLADDRLPEIMRRVSAGETVDARDEVSRLDFGTDELGQVARAFNRAHVAAVSAAVAEANTRAGTNTVFLDIAHRSQALVHRQLALLDQAERREENADQLELLFQVDHLATRARRNAENLIILGGKQPGRRWRNPVPLVEVVRSAVSESLDYTRIRIGRIPGTRVIGTAVADLIHLIAELVDNATSYSPPQARVEVRAEVVGRGVVVEIIDQGLGMSAAELEQRNEMLTRPPEFSVAALSNDTRLGLFVVAKLANRHGIAVTLRESVFGGVQAIVLIGTPVLVAGEDDSGTDTSALVTGEFQMIGPATSTTVTDTRRSELVATVDATGSATTGEPAVGGLSIGRPAPDEQPAGDPVHRGDTTERRPAPYQPYVGPASAASRSAVPPADPTPSAWFTPVRDRHVEAGAVTPIPDAPIPAAPPPQPPATRTPSPDVVRSGGGRPPLPRRTRATAREDAPATGTNTVRRRTAEQARNLISAVEQGSRRGRRFPADPGSPANRFDTREGDNV
ncbi:sensor histidine kinase [Nocardia vermiculata]|uniref:histidine kinase n=1 Tax=Nocardia vermiculata TaxID=257274 RepID=A0A846XPS6_9NOCA|nr:sensor histidine kinase [Nocardia vermiculata]